MPDQSQSLKPASPLKKQPNSRHCFVCGLANRYGLALNFYEDGEGRVVTETEIPEHYQGFPGVVHGGILAAMLDEVAGRAAMVNDPNRFFMTAKMTVRYREPVPISEPLKLVGEMLKDRGRIYTASAQIILPNGSIGAEAEATMVEFPELSLENSRLEALGWKVYPD